MTLKLAREFTESHAVYFALSNSFGEPSGVSDGQANDQRQKNAAHRRLMSTVFPPLATSRK